MKFEISLPTWAVDEIAELPEFVPDLPARMELVIRFSRLNFEKRTGGPFAAAVFERENGRLVSVGVNRVIPSFNSNAHAEIVAISLAQNALQTFDLGGNGMPNHQLVVNARPCAMCFGAIPWSGVRSLVTGASGEQVETLAGFDEGPIHPSWQSELQNRGIDVVEGLLADEAATVLREFGDSDQMVYDGRMGSP